MSQLDKTELVPAPMKWKSRWAHAVFGALLDGPLGNSVERALVWRAHRHPYRYLRGSGAIIAQITRRRAGDQRLVATLVNGTRLVVPPIPEGVGLYLKGAWVEADVANLFDRFLREEDIFFDIGANMGFYTFMAAKRCGPAGRVYAFEPQPNLVRCLQRSVTLNGYETWVVVEEVAVTDKHNAQVTLYYAANKETTGTPSILAHEWLDKRSAVRVPGISIDGYVQDRGIDRINAIKMDIEGAEMFALRGMRRTLAEVGPHLLVLEVLPPVLSFQDIARSAPLHAASNATRPEEVMRFLGQYGYEPCLILDDGRIGRAYTLTELQNVTRATNVAFVCPGPKQSRPDVFV